MIPMNMIPFITRMDNTKEVEPKPQPGPQPEPFDPTEIVHKFVFNFGELLPLPEWLVELGLHGYELPSVDSAFVHELIGIAPSTQSSSPDIIPFRFTLDDKEYVIVGYVQTSENSIGDFVDVYSDDITFTKHHNFADYDLSIYMDAETGDSTVVLTTQEE